MAQSRRDFAVHWRIAFLVLYLTYATADWQSDAGCHSSLYFNDHEIAVTNDFSQASVSGPNNSSITFVPEVVSPNPAGPSDPCGGPFPHLFVHDCPHNAILDVSQCRSVDTCPLVKGFPNGVNNHANEYIVHSAVASNYDVFVLTTDTGQSTIRIYRCDIAITKCIVSDIPGNFAPITIAQPFIKVALSFQGGNPLQLHITYDTWAQNAVTLNDYLIWITCDIDLTNFQFHNVSLMTNAPSTTEKLDPYPVVVRNFLHIATTESVLTSEGEMASAMMIYSCDLTTVSCTRRAVSRDNLPSDALNFLQGHALAYWGLNDNLYLSYIPNGKFFAYAGISRCALNSGGDLADPTCADSQFLGLNQNEQPSLTPGLAFADYLGAVIVVYQNIAQEGLLFVQYDADFSGDPQTYQYNSPQSNVGGADAIVFPSLFDIDSSTVLMRAVYVYANTSDASFHLHVGDVDVFPSQYQPTSILFFSPGYNKFYPPPLRQECIGTMVDIVASCPAVVKSGVCTQAWIFSGGDLAHPYIEQQSCFPKQGYGLATVYQRSTNPNSQFACVVLDDSSPPRSYFDDGPSIPLAVDLIENVLLGQIPTPPGPSTALSTIVNSALPTILSSTDSILSGVIDTAGDIVDAVNPGVLFSATSSRIAFWPGGKAHDYCYHNTVHYPGYDKALCDAMVWKRWAIACGTQYVSIIFGIISDIAHDQFPGESIVECEVLAFVYYFVLRTSNTAQQAYLASNSDVHAPNFSDIPDGFVFSGNNAPDPSIIHQNAVLINSTTYNDTSGNVKANLTRYLELLKNNPLIPTPSPTSAPGPALGPPAPPVPISPVYAPSPTSSSPTLAPGPVLGPPAPPVATSPVYAPSPTSSSPTLAPGPTLGTRAPPVAISPVYAPSPTSSP